MADPAIYDLSYGTNIAGVYRAPEYISRFVVGEYFTLLRKLVRQPKPVGTVRFVVKPRLGSSAITLTKVIEIVAVIPGQTTTFPPAGQIVLNDDGSYSLTFNFDRPDSALLTGLQVFEVLVVFTDGTSQVASQGYIQGSNDIVGSNNPPNHILIAGNPGVVTAGTIFQLTATAYDATNNIVPTPIYWFSDDIGTVVDNTGLVSTLSSATVHIIAGSIQNNVAALITVVVT